MSVIGKLPVRPPLSRERVLEGVSPEWTAEDRLLVIAALLPGLQDDIYAGRYSAPGRPNITSLQHVLSEPADVLEAYRADLTPAIEKLQALYRRQPQRQGDDGENAAPRLDSPFPGEPPTRGRGKP